MPREGSDRTVVSAARTVVLFTRDLRVHDHPALSSAAARGEVVPLVVLDPSMLARSPNRARFYLECLVDLDRSLSRLNGTLIVRTGDAVHEVLRVASDARCDGVALTADVGPVATGRVRRLAAACSAARIRLQVHPGGGLVEPGTVAPAGKDGYRVFGAYARAWMAAERRPLGGPVRRLRQPSDIAPGPRPRPESAGSAVPLFPGGEASARARFTAFLRSGLATYDEARNRLDLDGGSRLSPYLRFGCLSPLEVEARAHDLEGGAAFVRQLAWRDFFRQLLAADPTLTSVDLRPPPTDRGSRMPEALDAWAHGMTGVPLVDAGMRQLREEGWMHNRARMVTASFLTRRLGVPWQEGAAVFSGLLVDGDPANNAGNWQWVAGTGTDPRRMRSFNPVRQAFRCDPRGTYVRRWVEEVRDVPTPLVFRPWRDPELTETLGYPPPILPIAG
jgi:deoxyribodipyrimidine photo-lyase